MVAPLSLPPASDDGSYYEQLQEFWPAERAKRNKRLYQRKRERRVEVRAEQRDQPSTTHMSKALLAAQRELAQRQAEADARRQADQEAPDGEG